MTPPGRDNRNGEQQSGDAARPRPGFRQESERLVLTNQTFALAFSTTANGTIVSLSHRELQRELIDSAEAVAEGILWRLHVTTGDDKPSSFTNRTCGAFSHSLGPDRDQALRLRLEWTELRVGAAHVPGKIVANIIFPGAGPCALFELEIELPQHISVTAVEFPCLCAVGSAEPLTEESLFLPLAGGVLVSEPRMATSASGPSARWQIDYPGPASLQMLGYSCGPGTTAWIDSRDPSGSRKAFVADQMAHSNRLLLSITHHPPSSKPGLWSPGYPSAVGVVRGDWFEAARAYRNWASQQAWCERGWGGGRRLPLLTSSNGLWTSYWGDSRGAVAVARSLQRLVNAPVKLDWRSWHHCARNGAYPDYFPPRDGDEVFADFKRHLSDAGVLTQLSLDGLLASPQSETWQNDDLQQYALLPSSQAPADEPASSPSGLVPICPATTYWREKLVSLSRQRIALRTEGLHLEHLADALPISCSQEQHGHPPALPSQWADAVRAILADIRSLLGTRVHLAVDGPCETFLDLSEAFFTTHPAAEREGLFAAHTDLRCAPIPLFSAVYHDYATLVGPGASLANPRPHDPLWPTETVRELRQPSPLMDRDYDTQFYLEVARAALWGHQLLLSNFFPQQGRAERNHPKLAFLAAALRAQAWGVGALLPNSEFMGPLTIECPPISLDLLINPPGSAPEQRESIRRSIPPVLGSAWRVRGSGLTLALANIHHQPVEFATQLRSARFSVSLPIQLIGRTFSEDGDVPGATLRASGTDIGGHLPARSIVLVTLR